MTPQRKIAYLTTRVTVKVQTKFRAKAARQGKMPATALREIAEAFVEDRLTIQPHQPK